MALHEDVHRLADLIGIEPAYWDVYGNYHETTDETRQTLLAAIGFPAATDAEAADSLARFENDPWLRLLEPVTVLRVGENCLEPMVSVTLPIDDANAILEWVLECEDGQRSHGKINRSDLPIIEERTIDTIRYARLRLALPRDMACGYHHLRVKTAQHKASCQVIAAPPSAYRPDWLVKGHRRVWGVACQLYALRSKNDWGIGDFSDLAIISGATAKLGGAAVGLSPLHALFPGCPERASPYSPSSRLFINPLYIDITAVPEFAACDALRTYLSDSALMERKKAVVAGDQVAYSDVTALKLKSMAFLFNDFETAHPAGCGSDRRAAFDAFVKAGGDRLMRFATFEALHEHFNGCVADQWPEEYRHPDTPQCKKFVRTHINRINFFIYLQWEAERQLAAVASHCTKDGMGIGLYRDLAVGVAPGGADAWIDAEAFVAGVKFGAPPDPFAPAGQDWGMPPFDPIRLREMAYAPYIDMLRSNMRHAGAVRIDHIMWIQHMFWIPHGKDGRSGAYVHYPKDDLFAILALESERNRCLVVGEDLGTVPEGFRERMEAEGILSYHLLHFQRHSDGLFHRPEAYRALSLAAPASHDLPTLAGFWMGKDLQLLADIGLIAGDEALEARRSQRVRERQLLLAALIDQGLVDEDFSPTPNMDGVKTLIAAVHRFLARSPAAMMMMNLEDVIATTDQINVPGTVDEHPNWRYRLHLDVEELVNDPFFCELATAISQERANRI
ncbi:MAG: 4-alpha-glucanotransferase [Rhodospirillales bacterium]|nr:4-alpha-glucanotransferase [Rhodospirillales bacterium]